MCNTAFQHLARAAVPAVLAFGLGLSAHPLPARAQAVATVVNGDPITSIDVEEQQKFLRVVHKPASRDNAIEDLVADRIKLRQADRVGIDATDSDLTQALNRIAADAKTTPAALAASLQRMKANTDIIRTHLRAVAAWNNYVRARNKTLNVSEAEIDAALAQGGAKKADANYQLQQIVFVLPAKPSAGEIEQRTREAQQLRARFQDCASGLPLARALPDVAVKPPISRAASALSAASKAALDQTAAGRLTPPERSASGIEVVAVCAKDESDATSLRDSVQADLIAQRLAKVGEQMYQELRKTAVVEKR